MDSWFEGGWNKSKMTLEQSYTRVKRILLACGIPAKRASLNLVRLAYFPKEFLDGLEAFQKRNLIAHEGGHKHNAFCCPRCLKAHALKISQDVTVNIYSLSLLFNMLNCETGHNGFYVDRDDVAKVTV